MASFKELKSNQFSSLSLEQGEFFPIVDAVLSGKQSGKVFADDANSFFVQHKSGFSFLKSDEFTTIENEIIKLFCRPEILKYFHLYNPPDSLVKLLSAQEDLFNLRVRSRIQLRCTTNDIPVEQTALLDSQGLVLEEIDDNNFGRLQGLELEIEKKFWDSKEHFLIGGLGVCLLSTGGPAVAACYSAAIADNVAEVDIKTDSRHVGKGFGKLVAEGFLRLCKHEGVIANWDCFTDNIGSLAIARKVGFSEVSHYPFVSVFKKNVQS